MSLTNRQMAGHQRRTLRSMRERLLAMAGEWDGVDQFNMNQIQDLADRIEAVAAELIDSKPGED